MTSSTEVLTYVLYINSSDLERHEQEQYYRAVYVHGYTNLVLLLIIVVAAIACNTTVAVTVLSHHYLRQSPFYLLLLGFSLLFVLDCIFNGTISLAYMIWIVWRMPIVLCQLNTMAIHLTLYATPLFALLAAIDRYVGTHYPEVYHEQFTLKRQGLAISACVVISLIVSLPYVTIFLPVRPFPARMACGAASVSSDDHSYFYVVCVLVFVVLLPGIAVLVFGVIFTHTLLQNSQERQRIQSSSGLDADSSMGSVMTLKPYLTHQEIRSLLLFVSICAYCTIGFLPYVVHCVVYQLSPTAEDQEKRHWEVCRSPSVDALLAWFRYLACIVQPVATLSLMDDLRQETFTLLAALKSGSDSPVTPYETVSASLGHAGFTGQFLNFFRKRRQSKNSVPADSTVPVLFPTVKGLYLRRATDKTAKNFDYVFCDILPGCCTEIQSNVALHSDLSISPNNGERVNGLRDALEEMTKVQGGHRAEEIGGDLLKKVTNDKCHMPDQPAVGSVQSQNSTQVTENRSTHSKAFRPVLKQRQPYQQFVKRKRLAIAEAQLIKPVYSRRPK